jgi:hypothetical protein
MRINQTTTCANQTKREHADKVLQQLLDNALRRGFHGSVAIEVAILDGTIQNIRRRIEQVER